MYHLSFRQAFFLFISIVNIPKASAIIKCSTIAKVLTASMERLCVGIIRNECQNVRKLSFKEKHFNWHQFPLRWWFVETHDTSALIVSMAWQTLPLVKHQLLRSSRRYKSAWIDCWYSRTLLPHPAARYCAVRSFLLCNWRSDSNQQVASRF